jgi:hypothetical protein
MCSQKLKIPNALGMLIVRKTFLKSAITRLVRPFASKAWDEPQGPFVANGSLKCAKTTRQHLQSMNLKC